MESSAGYAWAQRVCTASLLCSVIIMLVGLVWAYRVGMRAVAVEHPLSHVQESVTTMRKLVQQAEAKAR